MKHIIKNITVVLLAVVLFSSCSKETGPLTDLIPGVAITVPNAIAYRPEPTVSFSKSTVVSPGVLGPITIQLSINAASGRTIKEITRVTASTSYTSIRSTGTTGFYVLTPIAVNSRTATFNTTLTEYMAKTGTVTTPATDTELAQRFYFRLTLDDGSVIYPEPVRVLVAN